MKAKVFFNDRIRQYSNTFTTITPLTIEQILQSVHLHVQSFVVCVVENKVIEMQKWAYFLQDRGAAPGRTILAPLAQADRGSYPQPRNVIPGPCYPANHSFKPIFMGHNLSTPRLETGERQLATVWGCSPRQAG